MWGRSQGVKSQYGLEEVLVAIFFLQCQQLFLPCTNTLASNDGDHVLNGFFHAMAEYSRYDGGLLRGVATLALFCVREGKGNHQKLCDCALDFFF